MYATMLINKEQNAQVASSHFLLKRVRPEDNVSLPLAIGFSYD